MKQQNDTVTLNHPFLMVPSSANYLVEYFARLGYTLEVHEDWQGLTELLTSTKDYPYEMDLSFTPEGMKQSFGFALYLGIDKLYLETEGRLITERPEFYLALTTMILGSQFFLAGFLAELFLRSRNKTPNYRVLETL